MTLVAARAVLTEESDQLSMELGRGSGPTESQAQGSWCGLAGAAFSGCSRPLANHAAGADLIAFLQA